MHHRQVSNGLGYLVKTIIWTGPVQNPHLEQAKENQIIDSSLVHLVKPFSSPDHVGPESIIKEEVQVNVPPPVVVDDGLIVRFPHLPNAMEGVLENLQFSISVFYKTETKRGITS